MAGSAITSIKNIIGYKGSTRKSSEANIKKDDSLVPSPTVGFRVGYKRGTTKLQVKVLGARHLPAKVGGTTASGYSIKVKLFPGSDKFETESKPESWPVYNENFSFEIANISVTKKSQSLNEILCARNFLVFTIYAVDVRKKKTVVGAATWPLDHTSFTHKSHTLDFGDNEELETPDIWRKTGEISSGIKGVKQNRQDTSNQLEVTMCYTPGNAEEGETDALTVGVTKLRWNVEKALEYEQKNALLYVKLNVLEDGGSSIKTCKTRRFAPNISVHLRPDKDNSAITVQLPSNTEHLSCQISLCTKPTLGKKIVFGRVVLAPGCDHWDKAFQMPTMTIPQWHSMR